MQIVLLEYVSLDGVIQAPGRADEDSAGAFPHGGWTRPFFPDHRRYVTDAFRTADAFIFGRTTYQIFVEYWPTVANPNDEVAAALNTKPKYVASSTLRDVVWQNTTILGSNLLEAVAELRTRPGRFALVVGSSQVAHQLIENDLIDEFRLMVHPIVLGGGKRLFPEDGRLVALELIETLTTRTGVVVATYRPKHDPSGSPRNG